MNTPIRSGALILFSGIALTACGGGGGGSGGNGGGAPAEEKAATAGVAASLMAKFAPAAAQQAEEGDDSSTTQSLRTKQQDPCGDSGSISTTQSTEDVGSPFAESLNVMTTTANDCRESGSDGSFSFSSRQDGVLKSGEAGQGTVSYIQASDISGDPANGPYIFQVTSSGGGSNVNVDGSFRGELHVCDGCANPTDGGTQEVIGYFESSFAGNDVPNYSTTMGDGPDSPVTIIIEEREANTLTSIDGRFGFSDNAGCDISSTYETVSDLVVDNSSGNTVGGELNVTVDDGTTLNVAFNSDGSVTVDNRTFTQEELAALADDCVTTLEQVNQEEEQT